MPRRSRTDWILSRSDLFLCTGPWSIALFWSPWLNGRVTPFHARYEKKNGSSGYLFKSTKVSVVLTDDCLFFTVEYMYVQELYTSFDSSIHSQAVARKLMWLWFVMWQIHRGAPPRAKKSSKMAYKARAVQG